MRSSSASNMFLIFAINIFASTLLTLQSEAATGSDAAQAPTTLQHVEPLSLDPRSASSQLREFIEACQRRVNLTCIRQVGDHLHNNKGMITKTCCHMLLSTGPDCYKVMHVAEKRFFPISVRHTNFLARRENLWNRCQKMNLPVVPGGFPLLPPKELLPAIGDLSFVEMCARKITPKCGHKIVMALTGNSKKQLDEDCCGKLVVRLGQSCHNEMVRALIDDVQGQMKAVVASNSNLMWEHCQRVIFG